MLKTFADRMSETKYEMSAEPLNSALFTTGNGYMGIRGSFEEFGSLRIQGAYIRGLIDEIVEIVEPFCDNEYMKHYYIDEVRLKHFEKQESIINFADIQGCFVGTLYRHRKSVPCEKCCLGKQKATAYRAEL